jgi:hypothetical protein
VDRTRAARARCVEDRLAVEIRGGQAHGLVRVRDVRRRRIRVDVHRHAADPHRVCAAHHAPRDLAAVGNEEGRPPNGTSLAFGSLRAFGLRHSRNTP